MYLIYNLSQTKPRGGVTTQHKPWRAHQLATCHPPPLEFTEKSKNFIEKSKIIYGEVQKNHWKIQKMSSINPFTRNMYLSSWGISSTLGFTKKSEKFHREIQKNHGEIQNNSSRNPKKCFKKSMSPGTSTCHPGVSPLLWGSPTAALSKDSHLAPKHAIQSCLFKIISF